MLLISWILFSILSFILIWGESGYECWVGLYLGVKLTDFR